jgi:formate hydrogenlyase subunit 3/multisubunit Na+/H+ antiporter MnhD subunit
MQGEIILACVAALFGTAILGVLLAGRPIGRHIVYGSCLWVAAVACATGAEKLLLTPDAVSTASLPLGLPWVGAHFRIDSLSAFFLIVINLAAAAASLFALGYGRHEKEASRVLPFYPAFLAGMNLVLVADDAFSFLISWEFMSLSSWALVLAHHHLRENVYAAYVYLLMASFGTLMLLLAFGLMAGPEGHYAFAEIRAARPSPAVAAIVLALALVGAGSKAGLVPLHAWLPLAHPAAPSHVSALMSAAMTKVAVYGFLRIVFELLGPPAWWWAIPVLLVGGASCVLGLLYALMQSDIKRVLAYSTIENIGLVFVGLGLALAFKSEGMTSAAALALTAGLFHALNHSLFKSLLFFGAGAVLNTTGERNMERLGGLIHRMPGTAATFLLGAAAISALPPLNGFASEWLTFQAVLLSPQLASWGLKLLVPATGAVLALAAALAAACFVRCVGMTFLGRARTTPAAEANETDRWSLTAMLTLSFLCLMVGLFPGAIVDALSPAIGSLIGEHLPTQLSLPWLSLVPIAEGRSSYNALLVFGFIASSAMGAALLIHHLASRGLRRSAIWDCGYPDPTPATQYSASSFSQPIRRIFGPGAFRAQERVHVPLPGDPRPARFAIEMRDPIWDGLYAPVQNLVAAVSERLNRLQFLTIRQYLVFVFLSLIILLLALTLWA